MAITYKDIDQLSQKSSVAGTEKIPVTDTQYITPSQIIANEPKAAWFNTNNTTMYWFASDADKLEFMSDTTKTQLVLFSAQIPMVQSRVVILDSESTTTREVYDDAVSIQLTVNCAVQEKPIVGGAWSNIVDGGMSLTVSVDAGDTGTFVVLETSVLSGPDDYTFDIRQAISLGANTIRVNCTYIDDASVSSSLEYSITMLDYRERLPEGLSRIQYFDTDGSNYLLTPIQYSSGNTFTITEDIQFIGNTTNKGTGWNAGGALVVFATGGSRYYGDGSAALSPYIATSNRVVATIQIGTSGYTTVSAEYNGATSSHNRSNSSLASYAGTTGYPIGCMTSNGGGVPSDGISLRFYSMSINKNDTSVFNCVPVITTSSFENAQGVTVPSGTVGVYDFVSGKLYTKSGGNNDFTPSSD